LQSCGCIREGADLGVTRRVFLARGGMMTMALAMRRGMGHAMSHPTPPKFRTQLNASSLTQFVDPLPLPEIAHPTAIGQARRIQLCNSLTTGSPCGSSRANCTAT